MVRSVTFGAAMVLGAGALLGQQPAVRKAPQPVLQKAAFQKILWLHGGPKRDGKFYSAVKAAGFTAVSVSMDQDPSVPAAHGLGYYHDQICGKGILEMRAAQYDPVHKEYVAKRDDQVLRRPAVLAQSSTLIALIGSVRHRLERTVPHGPWSISLGDEISVTRHANPLDFCFAPESLAAFRKFVTARYLSIDRLNRQWRTDYASFDRVRPMTADVIRRRELGSARWPASLAPWGDHREFMDREVARVVGAICKQIGRHAKNVPAGLTGMQQPSAYGGHDYGRLMPHCTFYEVYDIGGARSLAMSLAPEGATQVATLFAPKGPVSQTLVTAQLADLIAHGMSGVIVWSAGLAFDQESQPTPYGAALSTAMGALDRAAQRFAGAKLRPSSVWLVESQPSVRAWWMLDSRLDGDTWIKRLSSYEAQHSTSLAARESWIRLLEDLGLQPRFVLAETLAQRLKQQPPRVLVLPATVALSDASAQAIREYATAGGVVLADHTPGIYDERLVLRKKPALDDLFGVQGRTERLDRLLVREGQPMKQGRLSSGAAAAEAGIRAELSDPQGEFQVQLENTLGRGRAVYLNLAVCEYRAVRLEPKRIQAALDIRRRVRSVLRGAGVTAPVFLRAKDRMPTCIERMVLEGRDGGQLLALRVNALDAPALLQKLAARGKARVELTFPRPVKLEDVVTGKQFEPAMRHQLELDCARGLFLQVHKAGN